MSKTASVILVSYHTGPVLFACVKSVLRQKGLAELIIVDNGNQPSVFSRLQQMALGDERMRLISGHGNIGFAAACNKGAKEATGEYLLLLNPDCLLPPEALSQFASALEASPKAMLAGPRLRNPDGSEQRGGRRQLLTPQTALNEALGLHRLIGGKRLNEHESALAPATHEVPAISGACMFIRKSHYERLGGMDEKFFLHVEDLDLCMRVNRAGGKVICLPQVEVTHMLSTSGETTSRFIEWQKAKGFIYYFRKHFRESFPGLLLLLNLSILLRYVLKTTLKRQRVLTDAQSKAAKRLMILATGLAELDDTKELHGKAVLVTGATSQIGLCVLARFLAAGAAVLAISREDGIPFAHERLRWLKGDLGDRNLHLDNYLMDVVVHCAPLWHLPPVIGLLADAEVQHIVAFGSTSVFGKAMSHNAYEKDIVSKLAKAEEMVAARAAERDIAYTILRPTLIYGVGLDQNVTSLANIIRRRKFFPVYPPAFGRRQPVHADDLAVAALQASLTQDSHNKSYNVSSGEIVTYREMLERLFTLFWLKPRIKEITFLPFALDVLGVLTRKKHINGEIARRMNDDLVFFHDDASRDFGYKPRGYLSGGIKDIEGY